PDFGWRALGDDLAVVEHGDPITDAHHDPHVVLDEQDRQALFGTQLADEVGHLACLAVVHAGGRLVEQQELRPGGQGPGDREPAPFGPISDTMDPRGISKSTLLTAVSPPNFLVTPRERTRVSAGSISPVSAETEDEATEVMSVVTGLVPRRLSLGYARRVRSPP